MKKILFFGLFIIFSLNLCSAAADIAYVLKNPLLPDSTVISVIENSGYSYELIDDNLIPLTDFSDYSMILLMDGAILNYDILPIKQTNALVANTYYIQYFGFAKSYGSYISSSYNYGKVNERNIITKELNETLKLYTEKSKTNYYLTPQYSGGFSNVVSTTDSKKFPIIATIEPGNALYGGGISLGRMSFFGITESRYWTEESKELFANTLTWVIGGGDFDEDGFTSDVDCDDKDAEKWQYLSAYIDNDNDNYGAGEIVYACSGESLSRGYSFTNTDCDDTEESINPEAEEIAYNDIDENCDGVILKDVDDDGVEYPIDCNDNDAELWKEFEVYADEDADGYGAGEMQKICTDGAIGEGYSAINGDCDDTNEYVNPSSIYPEDNCKNDAPIIDPIDDIEVIEGEEIFVIAEAYDSEEDEISYSINSSLFLQENKEFLWLTQEGDAGEYVFKITASDGELETSKEFSVKIIAKNKAPLCSNIPSIEWDEDKGAILNLSEYCTDFEGEEIKYSIDSASSDDEILIDEDGIEKGFINFTSGEDWNGKGWIIFEAEDPESQTTLTNKINLSVNPINDAPKLLKDIEDIVSMQNLKIKIKPSDYFYDIDSNLTYSLKGNTELSAETIQGELIITPQASWFGSENISITASDGEYSIESNVFSVEVNEAPKFIEPECAKEISEDEENSCDLEIEYSITNEVELSIFDSSGLECSIQGKKLKYKYEEEDSSLASCIIRATDKENQNYGEYTLIVNASAVNDEPKIIGNYPEQKAYLFFDKDYYFSLDILDPDSDINYSWFLDNQEVSNDEIYEFNKNKGNYNVLVNFTDGEYTKSFFWDVIVLGIEEMTCVQAEGYICSENEYCPGDLLNTKDINKSCCSVACQERPPKFTDAEQCEDIESDMEIEIDDPGPGEDYEIGDEIRVSLDITNNYNEDIDADIRVYLFDITEDEIIQEAEESISIEEDDDSSVDILLEVPEDIEEDSKYAILVVADDSGEEVCNQKYVKINIKRQKDRVLVSEIKIPENLVCGDIATMEITVDNIGRNDANVFLRVENNGLNISKETEDFTIEKYGDKDSITKKIDIEIPSGAKAGQYSIKTVLRGKGIEIKTYENIITLEQCKEIQESSNEIETIKILSRQEQAIQRNTSTWIILILIATGAILLIYLVYALISRI